MSHLLLRINNVQYNNRVINNSNELANGAYRYRRLLLCWLLTLKDLDTLPNSSTEELKIKIRN